MDADENGLYDTRQCELIKKFYNKKEDMSQEKDLRSNIEKYGNNVCPICGHPMIKVKGCKECSNCTYFSCDI